ncbi:Pre-mRNA-splicing factor CWC22-like protein [Microtus ochrogaster]|uniref:Pre-mRNA-splicing factor CWC22-like protein n=1 Tax=Microtus ochrogaster TaxID=79684 RepID=A0A8J6GNZ2_MICOH|nr:Pre-mRNA-splicing factor CWC22-like protein [Microtus ochrogaster]
MLSLLLERPTDGIIEVCGLRLTQPSPEGISAIFECLRNILHRSEINQRAQDTIIVVFAIQKDRFKDHPVIWEGLDLVEEDDQATCMLPLENDYNLEDVLNVFKMDPNFVENEEKFKAIKKEKIEGDNDSITDQEAGSSEDEEEDEGEKEEETVDGDSDSVTDHEAGRSEDEEEEEEDGAHQSSHDKTEINLVSFHHARYLLSSRV